MTNRIFKGLRDEVVGGASGGGGSVELTGDVTGTGTSTISTTIANNAVTLAKFQQIATASFLGRTTASTGSAEVLSTSQATALLNAVVGDSGSGGTKGLVPAPSAGDAAANKFLKASGLWVTPAHNDLGSLQGGTSGEYYHLTSAQATVVGNTSGTNSGDQTSATLSYDDSASPVLGAATAQAALDVIKEQYVNGGGLLYGTGKDGALSASSGTTTLTADTYCTTVVLSGTAKIDTAGYALYASEYIDLTNAGAQAIYSSSVAGNNGSGSTAGGASTATTQGTLSLGCGTGGGAGGNGGTGAGSVGQPGTNATVGNGQVGGVGGVGGQNGAATAGANGGDKGNCTATYSVHVPFMPQFRFTDAASPAIIRSGTGGGGGGGGRGDGSNASGGGGGGGTGANALRIFAKELRLDTTNTAAGAIYGVGGAGGVGGNAAGGTSGGGAGGGGGAGATFDLVVGSIVGTKAGVIDISGGAGGNGGNGSTTGRGGRGGSGGQSGQARIYNVSAGTSTQYAIVAGTSGTSAVDATGGAGGAGGARTITL